MSGSVRLRVAFAALASLPLLGCAIDSECGEPACDGLRLVLRSQTDVSPAVYRIEVTTGVGTHLWTCDLVDDERCVPASTFLDDGRAREIGSIAFVETRTIAGLGGFAMTIRHGEPELETGPETIAVRVLRDDVVILEAQDEPIYLSAVDECRPCERAELELQLDARTPTRD